MSRLIDIDDERNCYIGMDGEYEQWNIAPGCVDRSTARNHTMQGLQAYGRT